RNNRLIVEMVFQGLEQRAALSAWQGLADFVAASPQDFEEASPRLALVLPARNFWDPTYLKANLPGAITNDDRPGADSRNWWWTGDGEQAWRYWHGFSSAWLPATLLRGDGPARLAQSWFSASRHWSTALHFNKGLAGASQATLAASRDTAINPEVLDAFALAIISGDGPSGGPGLPEPDFAVARKDAVSIQTAMFELRKAAPNAGCYLSEMDYFNPDWRQACWGANWDRLSRIKRRYDSAGLFIVHHGVGSEAWSNDGFVPAKST
ncbi:MAG: BBE domain-containing protein, partial [Phenylobacterium sp.]